MQFDDRVGPLCLCAAVVVALCAILLLSVVDFFEVLHAHDEGPAPPASDAGSPPPVAGVLRGVASVLRLAGMGTGAQ